MAQLKLIILDFDGTLVNTRRANYSAYRDALAEEGIVLDKKAYYARYFGMRCPEFVGELGVSDERTVQRIRHRKIDIYPNYFDLVELNAPLWAFCQAFRASGGAVWIASTAHRRNIENVMKHLSIEDDVDGVLTGQDVLRPKPMPDCFLRVMEIVGVEPSETLIFEDSPVGIEAARRSGATYSVVKLS